MPGFYVYAHADKNGKIRYVGKGSGKRAWSFLQRSGKWNLVFPKGNEPEVILLEENLSESDAFEAEIFHMSECLAHGFDLINITAGGYGGDTRTWTAEARQRLSEARKGEGSYWFGKKRDPEMIDRMKETKRLNPQQPYWSGKKRDPELIKKMTEASHSAESLEKAHQTRLENGSYEWSEDRRQAVSDRLKGISRSPEIGAKISAAKKGKSNGRLGCKVSKETREKMSKAAMGRVLSEESQQKRLATWKARGGTSRKAKKVRCVETGEIFRSSKEAAMALTEGKGEKVIQQCCVGSKPSYRGYRWEHVKEV